MPIGTTTARRTAFRTLFTLSPSPNAYVQIADFNSTEDKLDLAAFQLTSSAQIQLETEGTGTLIILPGNQKILVREIQKTQFNRTHWVGVDPLPNVQYLGAPMGGYNRTVETGIPFQLQLLQSIFSDENNDFIMTPKQLSPTGQLLALPAGLRYDAITDVLSGVLDEPIVLPLVMTATDKDSAGFVQSDPFYITVEAKPVVYTGYDMRAYSQTLTAGSEFEIAFDRNQIFSDENSDFVTDLRQVQPDGTRADLPAGLSYNSETGRLSGVLAVPQNLTLVLVARDKDARVETAAFTLTVVLPTTTALPTTSVEASTTTTPSLNSTTPVSTTTTLKRVVTISLESGQVVAASDDAEAFVIPQSGTVEIQGFDTESDTIRIDQLETPPQSLADIIIRAWRSQGAGRQLLDDGVLGTELIFSASESVLLPGVAPESIQATHFVMADGVPIAETPTTTMSSTTSSTARTSTTAITDETTPPDTTEIPEEDIGLGMIAGISTGILTALAAAVYVAKWVQKKAEPPRVTAVPVPTVANAYVVGEEPSNITQPEQTTDTLITNQQAAVNNVQRNAPGPVEVNLDETEV